MCYSSRLKIIKKQYLFRVSLDACTHEWRKIKKNIPRKAHRKSIICFFLLFVSEIWHTLQFTRQNGGGGGEVDKTRVLPFPDIFSQSSSQSALSCHHDFCIYLTPDQGTWKTWESPSIPSPGFLLVSLHSHIVFNNLKPQQGVMYSVLWGMNKHFIRSFCLFMISHVLFCRISFFFFFPFLCKDREKLLTLLPFLN